MRYPACTFRLGSVVRACWDGWARLETAGWAMGMAWLGLGVEGGREVPWSLFFNYGMQGCRRGEDTEEEGCIGGTCVSSGECMVSDVLAMYVCMRAIGTDSTSSLQTPACGGECLAVCTVPLLLLLLLLNYCELKTYLCYDTSVLD